MKAFYKNFLTIGIAMMLFSLASHAEEVKYSDSWGKPGMTLKQSGTQRAVVNFSVSSFHKDYIEIDGNEEIVLQVPGIFLPNSEGYPNLPGTGRYIAIPQGATPTVKILSARTETIEDIDIAPAPNIPLDTDDGPLVYERNQEVYSTNAWYPAEPVRLSDLRKIRGTDVVVLGITPFQYNPVTRELIVYRDIEVEVTFSGGNGHFGEDRLRSRWWDPIMEDAILNHDVLPEIDYSERLQNLDPSENTDYEYVIITPDDPVYKAWADSIKMWRTLQGIPTGVFTTTEVGGNNTSAIETFLNNAYNNWTIPPAAFLLIGDYGSSGNTIISPIWDNYCASDNIYADVDADDLPDMAHARMTAQDAAQLEVMVTKFLDHERNPPTNPGYYNNPITALGWQTPRWFQICSEVVGGFWKHVQGKTPVRINAIYSGTPGTQWSSNQNTYMVTDYFGPNGLGYIPATPAELGGWTGGNATMVNNSINSGAFMLQHRDHGSTTGWGEPDYQSSDINGLTNTDLVFVFSINCLTGKYNMSGECFAEKFHRYTYNGQNSGALGIIAASEVSYSFVNDTYVWGMMDNMWPGFMPDYGSTPASRDVLPAFGNAAGKHFLQASNWPYNPQHKVITHHLFHHHGDAFMTVYSEMPQNLTVIHDPVLLSGVQTYTVTADDGSFIALTVNGEIIGTAEGTGMPVNISIDPQMPGDVMVVTVTKQNYYRYSSDVNVIPPSGPYVAYESHMIDDAAGNNNGVADYGENILLDMTLENLGSATANNVSAVLISTDPNIVITDDNQTWPSIPAGTTSTQNGAFGISINDLIPDQHIVLFELQITGNAEDTWTSYFSIVLNAPVIELGFMTIDDATGGNGNGRLDPGETADLYIPNENTGSSASPPASATLTTTSGYVTINSGSYNIGVIDPAMTQDAVFNISIDPMTPIGEVVDLVYDFTAGAYVENKTYFQSVGLILEDWETGDFSRFLWGFDGSADWFIDNTNQYEGLYCAKSGPIDHSQSSELIVQMDVATNSTISFYRKVSSETDDYLKFYIDGAVQGQWSGEVGWGEVSYNVTAGVHQFKWAYEKDNYTTSGSDAAWVDYIIFPPLGPEVPQITVSTDTLDFENVFVGDIYTKTFTITNDGTGLLTGDITTPDDVFTVSCEGADNTYSYEVLPGFTTEFQVAFAPLDFVTYSGDMVITHNVGGVNNQIIYVTGTGINGLAIPYDQDFEEGGSWPYAWNNVTGDDFDWTMNSGGTPSNNTGPSGDHTTGTGYYIYTEASSPNYPGKVAIMETPVFDLATAATPTLIFWYHMYGSDMGELHLDVLNGGVWTNDFMTPIVGDQGNQWNLMVIDLSSLTGTAKFRLRGITGSGYTSDMAIDDFSLIDNTGTPAISVQPTSLDYGNVFVGGSLTKQFSIENTGSGTLSGDITTPPGYEVALATDLTSSGKGEVVVNNDNTITYSVPFMMTHHFDLTFLPVAPQTYPGDVVITSNDPNNPTVNLPVTGTGITGIPLPHDEDFEEGGSWPYAWINATGDDFDWELNTGSTPSSNTGPSGDHTTGSGYYAYTESSTPNYPSKIAILETPVFDLAGATTPTVSFWYHMYGSAMGELHVDAFANGTWTNDIMPPFSGNQGNQWLMAVVDLSGYTGTVKLRFRGITGTSYTSDMAIDDFSIFNNTGVPTLVVDPASLDFGSIWVGNTNLLQFTIENSGQGTLQGDITTPAGYSVVEIVDGLEPAKGVDINVADNTITYSVPFMTTHTFEVTFAPTASQSYDDFIVITSNDPNNATFDLPVFGTGVNPPDVDPNPTSFTVNLPPDGTTTELLTISNLGEADLTFDIFTFDSDFQGGKMDGYFSDEMVKAVESKPDMSNQTDELEKGTGGEEQPVLPMINKFGNEASEGEEVFGSWSSTFSGSNRDRGNVFHVTTPVVLTETRFYLNITSSTELYFFVYEGSNVTGTFTKVSENYISSSGTGEGWYSSGPMSITLDAGKYYYIGTSWAASATYGRGTENVPLPCSFGTLETGIPGTTAGHPPAQTCNSTYTGFSPYYQTIVTGPTFTWLTPTPNSGTVTGGSSVDVDLFFDATGLTEGTYTKDLTILSNDPDEPSYVIPVTLNVTNFGISLDVKAMLEGPYNGTQMTTFMNAYGYIPLNQPYNVAPWNYNGTEAVAAMPNNNVVDWVLIELRDAVDANSATGATMLARQAGFILNDGTVVGLDGASSLGFTESVTNNLFVVIWHRNHAAIMSGNPVTQTGGIYTYDFTAGFGQIYNGIIGSKDLGGGVTGMYGGDGNSNGQINNVDKVEVWSIEAGSAGYYNGDFNLNGNVDNDDKNNVWIINAGNGTQVSN